MKSAMISSQEPTMITDIFEKASRGLASFLYSGLQQKLEPIRLARVGYALLTSGCSVRGDFPGESLSTYLIKSQQKDGGLVDVEETLWCMGFLGAFGERYREEISSGQKWLASVRLPCGAWGKSERDQPRIPVTALAAALVPEIVNPSTLKWLANQWETDLESPVHLTYKGSFFLLAQAHSDAPSSKELTRRTVRYLTREQEEDGGFSPWRGHPVGSDPWSTGVVLWGLSSAGHFVPRQTVERALSWLQCKQQPDGLWPYHYLDDGSAMALIGISSILPFLSEQ